jgi:hypothetical protein
VGSVHGTNGSGKGSADERFPLYTRTHLDIVALVVITALPEQPVFDNLVDIQNIENGVCVLRYL